MDVAECYIAYVIGVFVEHRTGHERSVRQTCIHWTYRYERILEMLAHEHAYVNIPLDGFERHFAVGSARGVEIQKYPEIAVPEIDLEFASCVYRGVHSGEGIDELVAVHNFERLQHWPDIVLPCLAVHTADHFLFGDV